MSSNHWLQINKKNKLHFCMVFRDLQNLNMFLENITLNKPLNQMVLETKDHNAYQFMRMYNGGVTNCILQIKVKKQIKEQWKIRILNMPTSVSNRMFFVFTFDVRPIDLLKINSKYL